ncbi:hypothetical protein G4Z16_04025 [Streptomyces bathyalis]|uniref:Translation initiation factor IF-3 n=1 Tax=Streptomyces bathyalis TaxID=2710756 RepID=A0A7T1WR57_9ACTN|nr:hypothetical protein G4Z16_04025 [Streptomyces bathyalis]
MRRPESGSAAVATGHSPYGARWSHGPARLAAGAGACADRGGPVSPELRINERIDATEVRVVGPRGEQMGIVPLARALEITHEYGLDLVEVAATARPPVCKIMNYEEFRARPPRPRRPRGLGW